MDTSMGSLKPGVTYVYERVDNAIYAREFGGNERTLVGYETGNAYSTERKRLLSELNEVLLMCETDPIMNNLLEQLFVMYNLKKKHER
jgi:hypothetical protein